MSLGKYFWERYPLFQRFLKEPSRNLTLWWCDRLMPISFSSCSVNQEKCHISWKPGDKIAFFVLETVMARVTWVTFTASDLHRSFQVEFISTGFRAGAVSRVPGGSFRYWNTKSNFKANTEWWAGSVCNQSTPNCLFTCFYPWQSIAEQASEQPLDISASTRPRHERFFVSLGKDEALSYTNPGKPIPAWLVSNLPAGGETRVLQR